MSQAVEEGDTVTVVAKNDRTFTLVKRVTCVGIGAFTAAVTDSAPSSFYPYDYEGLTWLRGVHHPSSREVAALKAACLLVFG